MKFKRKLTYRNFLAYFSNKLERKDAHAFEKRIMQDSFDSEAYDGLSKLSYAELEHDMAYLQSQLKKQIRNKKRRLPVWLPYAASIAILVGLSSALYFLNQYSVQDELIGEQLEVKIEKEILLTKDSVLGEKKPALLDIVEPLDEGLEMEIEDTEADTFEDSEFAIVLEDEEEVEEEIVPFSESKEPMVEKIVVDNKVKSSKAHISSSNEIEKALSGRLAGVEISEGKDFTAQPDNDIAEEKKQQIITGIVLDENAMPLPGVSVIVNETGKGSVTNMDGQFQLSASDKSKNYKLTASFIGYEPKEINVQADSALLVILEPNKRGLNEVVVVGYGSKKEKSGTGSVSVIRDDDSYSSWEKAKPSNSQSISQFKKSLINKLDYSKFAHLHGDYRLKLSFVVDATGILGNVNFKGNPDSSLAAEIESLILTGEQWEAAKSKGNPVESIVKINLKIKFE